MRVALFTLALFIIACHCNLTVDTRTDVIECEPLLIFWSGGTGSTFLSSNYVEDAIAHTGVESRDFGQQTSPFSWNAVDIPAGSSLTIIFSDETGAQAQAGPLMVESGSDNSCLDSGSWQATTFATTRATTSIQRLTSSSSHSGEPTLPFCLTHLVFNSHVQFFQLYHLG